MASIPIVFAAFLGAILFFSCLGLALGRWIGPAWASGPGMAPALGWAAFVAVSFPLQNLLGFGRVSTALLATAAEAAAVAVLVLTRKPGPASGPRWPAWAFVLAALIAVVPLAALLPKMADGGVIIGSTAFDHSKIAMIDEMTRLGLPAGNPFFGAMGERSALAYYFLWHFGAAQLSILAGISGWEADAAMTGFTAFAALLAMMQIAQRLAVRAGGGPARVGGAVGLVAALSLVGSLKGVTILLVGWDGLYRILSHYPGLSDWLVQASWVPQHMASAVCVVLAVLLMMELAQRPRASVALVLGAVAAAGFGSSAWVGGVTFIVAAAGAGIAGLACAEPRTRVRFVVAAVGAAALAVVLSLPMVHAEFGTLATRQGGSPIGLHPYEVVGPWAPPALRGALDLPAFWLLLLPIELPAVYPVGMVVLALLVRQALRPGGRDPEGLGLAVATLAGLGVAWLLISTIGNNDLGWRAILPPILILIPVIAAALAGWIADRRWLMAVPALLLAACGGLEHQAVQNIQGRHTENAPDFARSPALWAAVRRYAGPSDRVANNPLFLDDLTDWPVNPSWAMLSNRASCFGGWETARAYVALPTARLKALDDQFIRVFAGKGSADDVRQMAVDYGCRVAVLVATDDAWDKDPFAASPYYQLVEGTGEWRIYRAAGK